MKFSRQEFYDWARKTVKDLEDHILLYKSIENLSFSDHTVKEIKNLLKNIGNWLAVHTFFGVLILAFFGFIWLLTWFLGGVFDFTREAELGDTSNYFLLLLFWVAIWIFILWIIAWYIHALIFELGRLLLYQSFLIMRLSRKLRVVVFTVLGGAFWLTTEYFIVGLIAWILIWVFYVSYSAYLDLLYEKASNLKS